MRDLSSHAMPLPAVERLAVELHVGEVPRLLALHVALSADLYPRHREDATAVRLGQGAGVLLSELVQVQADHAHVVHPDGQSEVLALRPVVPRHGDALRRVLGVEPGDGRMVRHLFCYEGEGVEPRPRGGPGFYHPTLLWRHLTALTHVPIAAEHLT